MATHRYYPGEWSSAFCRMYLEENDDKETAFKEICRRHSPCFRYFFMEKFGHCMEQWFASKSRYTLSVAVNSIVGHVLGIGDRHGSNILVHQRTGEIVQIDFGIVFEQGRLLRTPERVPFRLTQNVVDGFGPTGVEGAFTKASETTMRVLKHNSNALLTILTSIAADPLYRWAMSPVKARARQIALEKMREDDDDALQADENESHLVHVLGDKHAQERAQQEAEDDANRNDQATHVISKIQQKLQGYEDGTSGEQQEIEGQIQFLIAMSRDVNNLAFMYSGWAPWL